MISCDKISSMPESGTSFWSVCLPPYISVVGGWSVAGLPVLAGTPLVTSQGQVMLLIYLPHCESFKCPQRAGLEQGRHHDKQWISSQLMLYVSDWQSIEYKPEFYELPVYQVICLDLNKDSIMTNNGYQVS